MEAASRLICCGHGLESQRYLCSRGDRGGLWIWLLLKARVHQPEKIAGPLRFEPGQSLLALKIGLVIGVVVWQLIVPSVVIAWLRVHRSAGSPPVRLDSMQLTLIGIVAELLALLIVLGFDVYFEEGVLAHLGLDLNRVSRGLSRGPVGILIVLPLVYMTSAATDWVLNVLHIPHPEEVEQLQLLTGTTSMAAKILIVVGVVVVMPMFEEVIFRGHLQTLIVQGLRRLRNFLSRSPTALPVPDYAMEIGPLLSYAPPPQTDTTTGPRILGVVITSVIFAALHPSWTAPAIFVLSLGLGYAYERTGSLWTSVVMHAIFNGISVTVSLLAVGK